MDEGEKNHSTLDDATLWQFVDGELAGPQAAAIAAAALQDAELKHRIDALRAIKDGVLEGAPTPPADFAARIAAQAALLPATTAVSDELAGTRRFLRRLLVAAALLAAVGVAAFAFSVGSKWIEPAPASAGNLFGGDR